MLEWLDSEEEYFEKEGSINGGDSKVILILFLKFWLSFELCTRRKDFTEFREKISVGG